MGRNSDHFVSVVLALDKFADSYGVAVDDRGNILVADNGNHHIQKFTSEGQCPCICGYQGWQVHFNAHNKKVYVADTHNHRVFK
jgi:DNA-binding beta-propeller fold protein YncE